MESNIASNESNQLQCETCFKSYQRRRFLLVGLPHFPAFLISLFFSVADTINTADLLLRHRRRCRGPAKSRNRRTACNACVQAKAKCCHTQPTCSRCAKRGTRCLYSAPSAAQDLSHPEHIEEASSVRNQNLQSCPTVDSQSSVPEPLTWNFPLSPFPLDTFDVNISDFANVLPIPHPGSSIENSYISPRTHLNSPATSLTQTSNDSTRSPSNTPTLSTPLILTRMLGDYASLLIKGSCFSPFLHLPKVKNVEPDLTSFPFTSMAICSSTGMNLSTDKQFFRQAIDAARHRLIGNFVSSTKAKLRSDQMLRYMSAVVRVYAAVGCDTRDINL